MGKEKKFSLPEVLKNVFQKVFTSGERQVNVKSQSELDIALVDVKLVRTSMLRNFYLITPVLGSLPCLE